LAGTIVVVILLFLWIASAGWLISQTQLNSWLKYIYAWSVFPLIGVLVTSSIVFSAWLAPNLINYIAQSTVNSGTPKFTAILAILVTAPATLLMLWVWVKLLAYFDERLLEAPFRNRE